MSLTPKSAERHRNGCGGRPCLAAAKALPVHVLTVAQRVFLSNGYDLATIEAIAREAGVAKKTIYGHYVNKAGLFAAVVKSLRGKWTDLLQNIVISESDPVVVLERAAISLLDIGTSNDMIELHRLLLMEARRFPELVSAGYDERGTSIDLAPLTDYLRRAVANRQLALDDVELATEQFLYLVLGGVRTRILRGVSRRPNKADRLRMAQQSVRIFLHGSAAQTTATARWH